ncbi:prophage protein [Enterococcus faecalis AZ19]|nr:prophage protein [Enterococcus faecalis AZ19]
MSIVYLRKRKVVPDEEGNDLVSYKEEAKSLKMNVQSAGGQVAAAIYGEQLPYIKSCKYQGDQLKPYENEKDGICLYVGPTEDPDYIIESIQPFSTHLNIILKKRVI